MTYRQIEQMKETRKWITQIITPAFIVGLFAWSDPDIRFFVKDKCRAIKERIKRPFKKNEKES